MTYPTIPGSLSNPNQIMEWLQLVNDDGHAFVAEVKNHASSGTMTPEIAKASLDKFTWMMASADRAYEALEQLDVDLDVEDSVSDFVDSTREFGSEMVNLLIGRLREEGLNASLLYKEAQDRHYP